MTLTTSVMLSRQTQKSLSSATASEANVSLVIIENKMMSVSLPFFMSCLNDVRAQLITSLLKPMEEHTEDARNEEDLSRLPVNVCPSC